MLGTRIAALRKQTGMSQAELAKHLRISASAVGMYEQGRREPGADMLVALAEAFGVSTDYLLTGKHPTAGAGGALARRELAELLAELLREP